MLYSEPYCTVHRRVGGEHRWRRVGVAVHRPHVRNNIAITAIIIAANPAAATIAAAAAIAGARGQCERGAE